VAYSLNLTFEFYLFIYLSNPNIPKKQLNPNFPKKQLNPKIKFQKKQLNPKIKFQKNN
jgi:hypothetical protein